MKEKPREKERQPQGNNYNKAGKPKDKQGYQGKNRLSLGDVERYRKDNRCFKCGEQGHSYRTCPQKHGKKEPPKTAMTTVLKEGGLPQGSPLCYAWGKVREHDSLILFDSGSTHSYISGRLASKLGIHAHEMGETHAAEGPFEGPATPVTPLLGKLRLHVQGYVDKEDLLISPLKNEDVLLGAPWFDRMVASLTFPERKVTFKHKGRDITLHVNEKGHTIPLVSHDSFDKAIKSSISAYMIFVKGLPSLNEVSPNGSLKVDNDLHSFLNERAKFFIDDIPSKLPPRRGDDDHRIDLIPVSSPLNKPPY
ncbi:hypothetical protein L7F22_041141 [Adiantum nelumboides]|nr:hypothetical protein [Adiantum nelumboides]